MRVCPKCRFHDLPIWRNSRWYHDVDAARISDIEYWDKVLATKIQLNGFWEDGIFSYLLTTNGMVLRKETEFLNKNTDGNTATEKKEKWFKISIEKHRKKQDLKQSKLLEVSGV